MNKLAQELIIRMRRDGLSANRIVHRLRTLGFKTSEDRVRKLLQDNGEWHPLPYKAQAGIYKTQLEQEV